MLFLVFQAGENRYAIDASQAIEILPLVYWKPLAAAPAGVAGIFNYRGTPVPLIDLTELMTQKTSRTWMSTRIIVVNRGPESGDGTVLLGLLAEQVTETLRLSEVDFRHSAVASSSAPYLGRIAVQPAGMIQRVEIRNLLPADVQKRMFQEEAVTASCDSLT
jgi:chemotaxis-related protein WspB